MLAPHNSTASPFLLHSPPLPSKRCRSRTISSRPLSLFQLPSISRISNTCSINSRFMRPPRMRQTSKRRSSNYLRRMCLIIPQTPSVKGRHTHTGHSKIYPRALKKRLAFAINSRSRSTTSPFSSAMWRLASGVEIWRWRNVTGSLIKEPVSPDNFRGYSGQ